MSSDGEEDADEVCANCGKSAVDDIKLKICTACKLVKYCSVDCQKNHRPQHKKACKKKAAEIREKTLFTQPDGSCNGECPICCLPLPLDLEKSVVNSCCCKLICLGCNYTNKVREIEQGLEQRCVYCRELMPKTDEEADQYEMERAKANDPVALFQMGQKCDREGDYEGAVKYYTKAAAFGSMNAHYNLSKMYEKGEGVEKDKKKEMYHLEEAAIGGHANARNSLAVLEWENNRFDRAVKHIIIAAKLGDNVALDKVHEFHAAGIVSKEDYEAALRGYQAAVDATKSQQREAAEKSGWRAWQQFQQRSI
jgi:tetratricopeptide (TPR) repeat protein